MSDPNKLTRLIDTETATMSDRDRALVCKGADLTLMIIREQHKEFFAWLQNARPDPIACSPTVRR